MTVCMTFHGYRTVIHISEPNAGVQGARATKSLSELQALGEICRIWFIPVRSKLYVPLQNQPLDADFTTLPNLHLTQIDIQFRRRRSLQSYELYRRIRADMAPTWGWGLFKR